MVRRAIALSLSALLAPLVGCDDRPTVPEPAERVPSAAQHHGETLAAVGPAAMSSIFVYDDNITDASPNHSHDGPRIYIAAGHATDGGYVADELVLGDYVPGMLFVPTRVALVSRCTGTATYAEETWTLALGGSPECERYNGVFRARPPWVDSWDDPRLHPVAAAPVPPPALTLVLPPPTTPFARARGHRRDDAR